VSPRDKLFLCAVGVVAAGLATAAVCIWIREWQRRRRSAWNRRFAACHFADSRFKPSREELEQRKKEFAKYDRPTHLRTRAEEIALMPAMLRKQAP
jgi:type VI protein secretion system component VasK